MAKPVVGAQLFSLRAFTQTIDDIKQTFEKVQKIGYTSVQISGFGKVDPKDVARAVKDSGIKVAATHMGWPRFLDELDAVIEEHEMWGCRHAAIGGLPGDYFCDEGVRRFIDELGPVAEKLSKSLIDFSYHNHNHELAHYGGKSWLGRLYAQSSPDVLKAEIDTYWITAGGGDPAAWIRRCAGREPLVHLKDMCITPEREQRFAPVGEGNLNWPVILDACEESDVEYLLVEQDNCYGADQFEEMAKSYRNLKLMGYS